MPTSLIERLSQTRARLKRMLALNGAFWLIAGLMATVTAAGLVDWLLHVSSGLRLLFLTGTLVAGVWIAYRHMFHPLRAQVRDLDLALRLERIFPELGEQLSSTIDFLKTADNDPLAGSLELRNHVIAAAQSAALRLRFDDVLHGRAVRIAAFITALVVGITGSLVAAGPSEAAIALRRLANPFGGPDWPLATHIHVVAAPDRIAVGDPFSIEVVVSGEIPKRVNIQYRFAAGDSPPAETLKRIDETRYKGGLESVARSFDFSVAAGDARTGWTRVEVVPAPEVTLLRLRLGFPGYTGLAPLELPDGRGHVKAVVGTKVELTAASNKPLRNAELLWDRHGSTPATIEPDGQTIRASFVVEKDDGYRVVFTDSESMTNATRMPKSFRVEAVDDGPPEVMLEQPAGDRDVTANAVVPVKALVKDDFGIASIALEYDPTGAGAGSSPASSLSLFTTKKPTVVPVLASGASQDVTAAHSPVLRHVAEQAWSLEPLKLTHGQVVTLRVASRDFRDVPGPNLGQSREIRLRVVTKEEFLAQLENQQQLVREELERTLRLQQTAHTQVSDLQKQAEIVGKLQAGDVEKLQSAELIQRRVEEKVSASEQGLLRRIDDLLAGLKQNRVDDVESSKRLVLLRSELARIAEQHLPPIAHALTQARKSAKNNGASADQSAKSGNDKTATRPTKETDAALLEAKPAIALDHARDHQQQVIDSLAQMLEQLDKWDTVAEVTNDARDLERRQGEVAAQSDKLSKETLGKQTEELTAEQRAALAKTAGRQEDNRNQLFRVQRKMERLEERVAKEEPLTAKLLQQAEKQLQNDNLAGRMTEAANDMRQNRMGDSAQQQRQIAQSLRNLVETLEDRREQELTRLVKQLAEAEKDLAGMRQEQEQLLKKTKDAEQLKDQQKRSEELARLQKRQQELQKKTEEFARRLSRQRAQQASRRTGRAAGRMNEASQQLQKDQAAAAQGQQQQAQNELEQAQQELAKAREQAENELAQEQLAKVSDAIRQIHERQVGIADETRRLEKNRSEKGGKLTRGEMQSVSALGRVQGGIAEESHSLTEKLAYAKVFVLVIEQAVAKMRQAQGLLEKRETGAATVAAEDAAARLFAQLLDALRPDPQTPNNNRQPGGEGGAGGAANRGGGDAIPNSAQVKLVKLLQTDIHQKTVALVSTQKVKGQWNAEDKQSFEELSRRQGQLADLVREMTEPALPARP